MAIKVFYPREIPFNKEYLELNTGWIPSDETWTYASANTFTVSGVDVRVKYAVGTRIKLTQTTVKYFVVVASSFSTDTTVTITAGTDYTFTNAAVSDNYYSYAANPYGYSGFFTYTPTWTGFSVAPGDYGCQFNVFGKMMMLLIGPGVGTSNTTGCTQTLPAGVIAGNSFSIATRVIDNSSAKAVAGMSLVAYDSNIITHYVDGGGLGWTASGTKIPTFSSVISIK